MDTTISPTLLNLGELSGPVLVFGGPYGNLQATQAIKAVAEQHQIPASHIVCTGDAIAYCAQPQETLELLKDWGVTLVKGNCEDAMAKQMPDCGCGFDENTQCSLLSVQWYQYCQRNVSAELCEWMDALPEHVSFTLAGRRFLAVHGSLSQMNEFVFASSPAEHKQQMLAQSEHDVILGGHCGLPFGQSFNAQGKAQAWLNAGVIGMPANDGQQNGWYLLLTPEPKQGDVVATWHRLDYDAAAAQVTMQQRGLDNGYAQCLTTGLWPSMDVLPQKEAAQIGQAIVLAPMIL